MEDIFAYLAAENEPTLVYLATAVVFLLFNCLCAFLLQLLLPWQVKRLLKKWKITLKSLKKLPVLSQLDELAVNLSGTISYGAPAVTDIYPNGISSARLLALAAAIEGNSHHPIGEAIVDEAKARGLELPEVTASNPVPGKGAEALMNRQTLSIGSAEFFQEQDIDIPAEIYTKADQLAYKGNIIAFVAIGKFCRGFITLQDRLKRSVPGDINFLKDSGINVTILTGFNRSTAKGYLRESNAAQLKSQLSNMDKAKEVLLGQAGGKTIGTAGRTSKFDGAMRSGAISFALEYADQAVKLMADVLIHTNNLGTIATAKNIALMARGKHKTGLLLWGVTDLLLIIALIFLTTLEAMPTYAVLLPAAIGIIGSLLVLLNQIPLRY